MKDFFHTRFFKSIMKKKKKKKYLNHFQQHKEEETNGQNKTKIAIQKN